MHGKDTKFMDELSIGDAIIITHPTRSVRTVSQAPTASRSHSMCDALPQPSR